MSAGGFQGLRQINPTGQKAQTGNWLQDRGETQIVSILVRARVDGHSVKSDGRTSLEQLPSKLK